MDRACHCIGYKTNQTWLRDMDAGNGLMDRGCHCIGYQTNQSWLRYMDAGNQTTYMPPQTGTATPVPLLAEQDIRRILREELKKAGGI